MQYLDLVRDCIDIFSLLPLPPNDVEAAHVFHGTMDRSYGYALYDAEHHRDAVKSELYDASAHALKKKLAKERREKKETGRV